MLRGCSENINRNQVVGPSSGHNLRCAMSGLQQREGVPIGRRERERERSVPGAIGGRHRNRRDARGESRHYSNMRGGNVVADVRRETAGGL